MMNGWMVQNPLGIKPMVWLLVLGIACIGGETLGLAQDTGAPPQREVGEDKTDAHGSAKAKKGGAMRLRLPVSPPLLHPLNATDAYGNRVLDSIYESLADTDVDTLRFIPLLASRWKKSPDSLTYTFYLNPKARWHDGKPVTAGDVAFSFDVLFDSNLKTRAKWQSYYSNIASVRVIDTYTVRFRVKRDHFRNFINLATLRIVPKHYFKPNEPNQTVLAKKPVGSGPYRFVSWKKGSRITLKRHAEYWGKNLPQNRGRYNLRLLLYKVVTNNKVALQSLQKGELDLLGLTPEQWKKETKNPKIYGQGPITSAPVVKLNVQNLSPRSYSYVGWNLASPLFNDRRVRLALSHLFDRKTFIQKLFHGLREEAVGPFASNSRYRSPKIKPIPFSIAEAGRLFKEAGWTDSDQDGVLDKKGQAMRFTVLTADPETGVKMLTLAKQSMQKAGVDLRIKVVDWAALLKLIDDLRFDAVMLGWSRSAWPDPTALWHSKSAVAGGLNLVRYKNPEVDNLIAKGVKSIPDKQRVVLFRRIHEILFRDQPYTFLLESGHQLTAYRNRYHQVKPWFHYSLGSDYWWEKSVK